ncbi:flagellar motor switch protein FliN [Candidatus Marinamargulisbacteria bacterium SCGC AG-414-C22]|nr:flagellar motor switch protein FliN [Candidatus Marinamargulisbacteria bacterium SCGC AG-414-C22]
MVKENKFEDPLEDIDPVMEDAFSSFENVEEVVEPSVSASEQSVNVDDKLSVSNIEFPEIEDSHEGEKIEKGVFSNIPVQVSVELGRSTISLKEIYELSEGSIIELDRLVGEPLDLVVNGQVIAHGEVVAIDNNFGLRIKSIIATAAM